MTTVIPVVANPLPLMVTTVPTGPLTGARPVSQRVQAAAGGAQEVIKGCCLDKTKFPGNIWSIGSKEHVYWSMTDQKTCEVQGNTCGDSDQLCGKDLFKFHIEIKTESGCEDAKNKWEETF